MVGALDSCTVSNVGAPLAPLFGAFPDDAPARASGSSWFSICAGRGVLDVEVGVELCTTIFGVAVGISGFRWVRKEFLRDEDGGGDLSRGDRGHVGVFSPEPVAAWTLDTLGNLDVDVGMDVDDGSEVGAG